MKGLFEEDQAKQRESFTRLTLKSKLVHVFVLSGLGLFIELLLIRWLDAEIRPLAYVRNLPLIGSFLGLGIGYALAGRRPTLYPLSALLLCLVLIVGLGFSPAGVASVGPTGPESNLGVTVASTSFELLEFYLFLAFLFGLIILATIPLGQIAGDFMVGIKTLRAYTCNIAGALTGILAFFILSGFSVPPWVSAIISFAGIFCYLRVRRKLLVMSVLTSIITCTSMFFVDCQKEWRTVWTPYNKIELSRLPTVTTSNGKEVSPGYVLRVQNLYYQRILDLREETAALLWREFPVIGMANYAYNYPYRWASPGRALVIGAGTGNDVAAALRHGAEHVDAVEIDPVIVRYGLELHPERPYQDSRVHVFVDDARAFLRRPGGHKYDLVVFGLLDAHISLFSAISSNIRLDNYVYTVEAFRDALAKLAPGGVLSISFYAEQPWLVTKLEKMLREAWGRPPLATPVYYDSGYLFLAGSVTPDYSQRPEAKLGLPDHMVRENPVRRLATDAWPFLYLQDNVIPATTLYASAGVLLVGFILVHTFFNGQVRFDRHLFFLGTGFLLVETRSIALLGLLFGTTWMVNAIAIGGVLVLILLANLLVEMAGVLPRHPLYIGLALTLVANYLVPISVGLGGGLLVRVAMTGFLLLPLFFAALIFASSIKGLQNLAPALASNMVGSVFGGLLENLSMVFGIPALSLVGILVYAASLPKRTQGG